LSFLGNSRAWNMRGIMSGEELFRGIFVENCSEACPKGFSGGGDVPGPWLTHTQTDTETAFKRLRYKLSQLS